MRVVAFVDARLRNLSNKDAAIASGYSPASASAAGARMAKSADVLAEIKARGAAMAAASCAVDPMADADPATVPVGLADSILTQGLVKWADGSSFLLAVVNAPMADLKVRVDAAFKLERIKAGFGGGKTTQPGLFDKTPAASADSWAAQAGTRPH